MTDLKAEVEMLTRPELIAALEMADARVAELEAENAALLWQIVELQELLEQSGNE